MSKRTYGHVLLLPSRRLVHPAADDDFVICQNRTYGHVLVLSSQRIVRPAADDDFVRVIDVNEKKEWAWNLSLGNLQNLEICLKIKHFTKKKGLLNS